MIPPDNAHLLGQFAWLLLLAIPVACVTWTVTHEEVLREMRDYCTRQSRACPRWIGRKFFYLFTCEYCFSHWVTVFFLALTGYKLLLNDWRGYVLAFFSVVWVANIYMNLYGRMRVHIRAQRAQADVKEREKGKVEAEHQVLQKEAEHFALERERLGEGRFLENDPGRFRRRDRVEGEVLQPPPT